MVHGNALNSYKKAQVYDEMDPNRLILMLYEGAIKRIILARDGLKEDNPQKRGENLGKAIAIIAELNASLDSDNKTDEINFLRNLYAAMLVELPKVSVNKDIKILDRSEKYLSELKRIWETSVMNISKHQKTSAPSAKQVKHNLKNYTPNNQNIYQGGSVAV